MKLYFNELKKPLLFLLGYDLLIYLLIYFKIDMVPPFIFSFVISILFYIYLGWYSIKHYNLKPIDIFLTVFIFHISVTFLKLSSIFLYSFSDMVNTIKSLILPFVIQFILFFSFATIANSVFYYYNDKENRQSKKIDDKVNFKKSFISYLIGTLLSLPIIFIIIFFKSSLIFFIILGYVSLFLVFLNIYKKNRVPIIFGFLFGIFSIIYFIINALIGVLVNPPSW